MLLLNSFERRTYMTVIRSIRSTIQIGSLAVAPAATHAALRGCDTCGAVHVNPTPVESRY